MLKKVFLVIHKPFPATCVIMASSKKKAWMYLKDCFKDGYGENGLGIDPTEWEMIGPLVPSGVVAKVVGHQTATTVFLSPVGEHDNKVTVRNR